MNKSSLPHTALTNLKRRKNLLGLDDYPGNKREPNASPEPRKQSCQYFALSEPEPYTVLFCYLDMERKQSHKYFALSEPESYTVLLSRYGKEISLPIDHNTLVHSTRRLNPLEAGTISVLVVTNICCTLCILFFTFPTRQIL